MLKEIKTHRLSPSPASEGGPGWGHPIDISHPSPASEKGHKLSSSSVSNETRPLEP